EVRLKEIHLQAAKGTLAAANRRLHQMNEQNHRVPGSISSDEIRSAQSVVDKEEFDVRIKEAEWQKSLVHLKQAERRLARLQPPKDRSPVAEGQAQAQKLRELERKVESLLKEIHNLRHEMHPDSPRDPAATPPRTR